MRSYTSALILGLLTAGTSLAQQPMSDYDMQIMPDVVYVAPEIEAGPPAVSLSQLEGWALANNPTLVQATAQVRGARGAAYQAGLYLNPNVGYAFQNDAIGNARDETWNGGYISQEFVTGGKLRLSRAKWCQRVRIAETNMEAQRHRVINDVRAQFYRTLAAQRSVEIHREFVANGEDNQQTHEEMLNVGQTNHSGLLRVQVELQRDRLNLQQAENEFSHAWRTLTSLAGVSDQPQTAVQGSLIPDEGPLDWESALAKLLASSPEMEAAWQKIRHDEITVKREQVEPIPNITASLTSIRSPVADTTETSFTLGIPLPVFDRNQGTVRQARADLMQSHAEARRLELELRSRLATQFRVYQTAWQKVQDYNTTMLPKAKRSYDLLHESYKARRAPWTDVLMAQRFYLGLRVEQVANLVMYRESDVAIRGMLLTGGLTIPPSPINGGHIDAVPKPR